MAGNETSKSDAPRAPLAADKAVGLKVQQGQNKPEKLAENQKIPEKKDAKPQKTDIEIKQEAVGTSKLELQKKKNAAKEIAEGKKSYEDNMGAFEEWDSPGLVPSRPDQQMIKKRDFERSQKELQEQERKTAQAIEQKMNAELESVTKTGKIDQLNPAAQAKIRTEVLRSSINPQLLPDEKKKEILSTMKGPDGQPIDLSKVKLDNLTRVQKEFILNSDTINKIASTAVDEYKKLQSEAQKTGKKPDKKVIEELQKKLGLQNTDALELSELRPGMKLTEYPSNTQIGIVQRVITESTFGDLQNTLSDGLRWSHIPDMVKREVALDSFEYDPLKNSKALEQAIIEAKIAAADPTSGKIEGESDVQFASRIKEKIGVNSTDLEALSLEAKKSGLSPAMRMLADFFGPIGAALGIPFWQEYMGDRVGGDDDFDNNGSDRWSGDARGSKANIGKGVLRSNKGYLDSGSGTRLDTTGTYEKQASSASEAIKANEARYRRVAEATGVPWELIGAIHFRESSLSFNKVLHNGDPLGQKTTRVPAGRGPFATWEESAIDALNMKGGLGFNEITQTNQLEQVAGYAEKYNGFGYRNKGVSSAYVWAGTEAYTGGMYVADHVFSRTKKDPRPGVMAIISKLIPESVKTEKRTPDVSGIASTAGAFSQEFESVGAKKNPKTGTTLCSQTAREDLYRVLGRTEDIPRGNANDVNDIYQSGSTFEGMVGPYASSFSPPENANVADVSLTSKSQYGHRVTAYKGPNGWMVLDPYNGGAGSKPQPWDSYVKKDDVRGVAFYQKEISKEQNPH